MIKNKRLTKEVIIALLGATLVVGAGFGSKVLKDKEESIGNLNSKIVINSQRYKDSEKKIKKLEGELSEERKENEALKEKNSSLKEKISSQESPLRSSGGDKVALTLTYYGEGAEENGGYAKTTAYGDKLVGGTVASNVHPRGTKFAWGGNVYTVNDTGGGNFNSANRLDVFVPRREGESKYDYDKRISSYGVKTVYATKLS